ncbi:MAG: TIGR04283 family arsenosugar biosynthesis glycosyltransferase [Deltaproteobacteria bacterium]|nr:TIGR04283 family arsenosugar biosynthesis glycosyltransferase [Deltaproteobacteria bacterium]
MEISVIIPSLNEAAHIEAAISSAKGAYEVIVVDAGSGDGTSDIARRSGARVINALPGRGGQMDAGAASASGGVLLFLHADALLPRTWLSSVRAALEDGVVGGAFRLSIRPGRPSLRLIELAAGVRARLFGIVYGDQALFVRKDAFMRIGGFRKLPLMEDVDCVKRLKACGSFRLLKDRVTVSSRRWDAHGAFKTTFRNIVILSMYLAGWPCARLYAVYHGGGARPRSGVLFEGGEGKGNPPS